MSLFDTDMIKKKNIAAIIFLFAAVLILAFICLFIGSSDMSIGECLAAISGKGNAADIRIVRNIRIPRIIAALVAGAGLSVAGLIMQTILNNSMASPSTLGVSNAAVFGANISLIVFAGGFLNTGNQLANYNLTSAPFATALMALLFSLLSVLLILGLCRMRSFSPSVVVLAGIAIGSVWNAATTLLQFFATDVGISAAVIWSFGDLSRATYKSDVIMLVTVLPSIIFFMIMSWKYNAVLSGSKTAVSLGINVSRLRFISLFLACLITAVCVSFLGIIGFVGIICPHTVKKILCRDHRVSIPASALSGSLLLLTADTLSRSIGHGSALPVGAITALLGAPFFVAVILGGGKKSNA